MPGWPSSGDFADAEQQACQDGAISIKSAVAVWPKVPNLATPKDNAEQDVLA
ncbi:hypothetical protein [Phyllobacterium salinisoli]|uniref:hypothetical protein n=1 Tax=Phyllobacterium salinisoli TaxID=1899321 RepID=UPI0013571900|nr:hypothetical protein [Phyllobacterium salinisoli]